MTSHPVKRRKKLIEVAFPLEAINAASAREKIRRSWRRCCADNAEHPEAAELFNPEKLPGLHDPFAGGGPCPWRPSAWGWRATPVI